MAQQANFGKLDPFMKDRGRMGKSRMLKPLGGRDPSLANASFFSVSRVANRSDVEAAGLVCRRSQLPTYEVGGS